MALTKYPIPEKNVGWYQSYESWSLVTQSLTRMQLPYITRNKTLPTKNIPIHYYMNETFIMGTNYLFSTSTENFICDNGVYISLEDSKPSIILPWGEVQNIPIPYINVSNFYTIINETDKKKIININIKIGMRL